MKGKNTQNSPSSSHEVTIVNGHAMVKYTQDISYTKLLDIFWIPKDRGDIIRSLIKGNGLSYNPSNSILSLENGRPIPTGQLIKLPTRNVSAKIIQEIENRNKSKSSVVPKNEPRSSKVSSGVLADVRKLLEDRTLRYSLLGWTAVIAAVSIWIASILSEDTPVKKRYKKPVTEEVAANDEEETPRPKKSSKETTEKTPEPVKDSQESDKTVPSENDTRKNEPIKTVETKEDKTIVYLGKEKIDMTQVGTLVITPNSKSKDIVALIKGFNAATAPKEKTK